MVALGNGSNEVTVGGNHEQPDIGLGRTGDHVLNEIAMARGIDNGVMVGRREEFLSGASNGNTTGTLFLGLIHVESESERILTKGLSFILQLLHLSLRDTPELENQSAGGGRLAGVDMTADNDGDMLLSFRHFE